MNPSQLTMASLPAFQPPWAVIDKVAGIVIARYDFEASAIYRAGFIAEQEWRFLVRRIP